MEHNRGNDDGLFWVDFALGPGDQNDALINTIVTLMMPSRTIVGCLKSDTLPTHLDEWLDAHREVKYLKIKEQRRGYEELMLIVVLTPDEQDSLHNAKLVFGGGRYVFLFFEDWSGGGQINRIASEAFRYIRNNDVYIALNLFGWQKKRIRRKLQSFMRELGCAMIITHDGDVSQWRLHTTSELVAQSFYSFVYPSRQPIASHPTTRS